MGGCAQVRLQPLSWANSWPLCGALRELRVWDHARGGAAVVAAMLRGLRGDEPGLLAHLPLNPADPACAGVAPGRWRPALPGPVTAAALDAAPSLRLPLSGAPARVATPSYRADGGLSVEVWLRPPPHDPSATRPPTLLTQGNDTGGWALRADSGRVEWALMAADGGVLRAELGPTPEGLEPGWLHISAGWHEGQATLTLNGQHIGRAPIGFTPTIDASDMLIGGHDPIAGPSEASFDLHAVALWAGARAPDLLPRGKLSPSADDPIGRLAWARATGWAEAPLCAPDTGAPLPIDVGEAGFDAPPAWRLPGDRSAGWREGVLAAQAAGLDAGRTAAGAELDALRAELYNAQQALVAVRSELQRATDEAQAARSAAETADACARDASADRDAANGELDRLAAEAAASDAPVAVDDWLDALSAQVERAAERLRARGAGLSLGRVELDVDGACLVRTRIVPVPAPPLLEERVRLLLEAERRALSAAPTT